MKIHYRFETWPAYEHDKIDNSVIDKMHNRLVALENSIRRIDENIENMANLNARLYRDLVGKVKELER
jgi:hypothetical protein